MKRLTATAAALFLIVACTDVPTQPVSTDMPDLQTAYGTGVVVPGLSGQAPFSSAVIDVPNSFCRAEYAVVVDPQNSAVSSRFAPAEDIHVTQNKNMIKATCKFLDTSGAYEDNAEVGPVENCTLITEDGTVYEGGTGHLTSAENLELTVEDLYFGSGGNTTLKCTFDLKGN